MDACSSAVVSLVHCRRKAVYMTVKSQQDDLYAAVKRSLTSAGAGAGYTTARPAVRPKCGVCNRNLVLKKSTSTGRNDKYDLSSMVSICVFYSHTYPCASYRPSYLFYCEGCNDSFNVAFYLRDPFATKPNKKCPQCQSTLFSATSDRGEIEQCPRGCGANQVLSTHGN